MSEQSLAPDRLYHSHTYGSGTVACPSMDELARLPDGQFFNKQGVEAFERARADALACGLDIKVVSALRDAPVPIYPFRSTRPAAAAHHSTHDLERGAIGIDIAKWWQVKDILESHGFKWRNHPDHPGHFDYLG